MYNPKKVCKQLFSKEKDLDYLKCIYKIISKLISIEVLWKLSYLNTLIKYGLKTLFIILLDFCYHSYVFFGLCFYKSNYLLLISYLGPW